ncbi:GrpB family protein [Streptomyces sp. NPDC101191]|uniref:GrpB family protein n=1 Tax=Streptomyces sp. NPDC101191 TaxID=3366126 RepID=UPI00382AED4B
MIAEESGCDAGEGSKVLGLALVAAVQAAVQAHITVAASPATLLSMGEPVEIMPYDPAWPVMFAKWGTCLRVALGDPVARIDHIGSTSVPGLAAKPVIDIQISVASLEATDAFLRPLTEMGLVYRADNPERTKRYFREPPGQRRTHVHVRQTGSFSQQFPLLFRDYLRCHTAAANEYAAAKKHCAARFRNDRPGYVQAKDAFVWDIIRRADAWAQNTGWAPGPSDA